MCWTVTESRLNMLSFNLSFRQIELARRPLFALILTNHLKGQCQLSGRNYRYYQRIDLESYETPTQTIANNGKNKLFDSCLGTILRIFVGWIMYLLVLWCLVIPKYIAEPQIHTIKSKVLVDSNVFHTIQITPFVDILQNLTRKIFWGMW